MLVEVLRMNDFPTQVQVYSSSVRRRERSLQHRGWTVHHTILRSQVSYFHHNPFSGRWQQEVISTAKNTTRVKNLVPLAKDQDTRNKLGLKTAPCLTPSERYSDITLNTFYNNFIKMIRFIQLLHCGRTSAFFSNTRSLQCSTQDAVYQLRTYLTQPEHILASKNVAYPAMTTSPSLTSKSLLPSPVPSCLSQLTHSSLSLTEYWVTQPQPVTPTDSPKVAVPCSLFYSHHL